jgi:predicted AlkP superfamily phosphohydrolase/phosphomutase
LRLLNREPWNFFMAVFGESDTVAHHFWMFHDPASPRHLPNGPANAIRQIYQRLDQTVGKLIEAAQGATVAVVSDHGFGGAGDGVVHINNWLAGHGHLRFASARENVVKKLALTVTPPSWRGKLFRRFRGMAAGVETRSRFGGIDWLRTRAWSEELNYFPTVRINLRGREPMGQVDPAGYDAYCRALCKELEAWPVIQKAWRRDEIYHGGALENAPDIVLELALENGYSYSCLRSRGGPAFRRMRPDEFVGGKERGMNGNHRLTGIFLFSKPVTAAAASIEDVAPTVLAELGVACPPMDGTPITGVVQDNAPPQQTVQRENAEYSPEQQQVVEDRLRALGYLE